MNASHALTPVILWTALTLVLTPAAAQYKVVSPDGKVTYTDKPPVAGNAKVKELNYAQPLAAEDPQLPQALRGPAQKYPVRLYTMPLQCDACGEARRWLMQRGIPFSEFTVSTREDLQALKSAIGGDQLPAITIGKQAIKGWSASIWASYLEAAKYPSQSALTGSAYNWPSPQALAPKPETPAASAARPDAIETPKRPTTPAADPAANPAGIRF